MPLVKRSKDIIYTSFSMIPLLCGWWQLT